MNYLFSQTFPLLLFKILKALNQDNNQHDTPRTVAGGGGGGGGGGSGPITPSIVSLWSNAGGVGHHLGDVALLVNPVEQVGHGSHGPDTNVVPAVSFRLDGLAGGLEVGEVGCLAR